MQVFRILELLRKDEPYERIVGWLSRVTASGVETVSYGKTCDATLKAFDQGVGNTTSDVS